MACTSGFRANIPEVLSLSYPDGREVDSKFAGGPKQIMFTLEGDRRVYLYPDVAAMISNLGIGTGELFSICKRVMVDAGKPKTQWEVKRVAPPQAAPATTTQETAKTKPELMNELGRVIRMQVKDVPSPAGRRRSRLEWQPVESRTGSGDGARAIYLERSCLLIDVVAAAHKYAVETYNGAFTKERRAQSSAIGFHPASWLSC